MPDPHLQTNLPSIQKLRAATSPPGVPPFRVGTGTARGAGPQLVERFEGLMANMVSQYREGSVAARRHDRRV